MLIGCNHIFYKSWYNKGICLVNDLIREDGSFYTFTELNSIYNVNSNFLNYNGIVKSIKVWISKLNIDSFKHKLTYPILPLNIQALTKQQKGSYI